jgi:hypothetical protein
MQVVTSSGGQVTDGATVVSRAASWVHRRVSPLLRVLPRSRELLRMLVRVLMKAPSRMDS